MYKSVEWWWCTLEMWRHVSTDRPLTKTTTTLSKKNLNILLTWCFTLFPDISVRLHEVKRLLSLLGRSEEERRHAILRCAQQIFRGVRSMQIRFLSLSRSTVNEIIIKKVHNFTVPERLRSSKAVVYQPPMADRACFCVTVKSSPCLRYEGETGEESNSVIF